MPRIPDFSQLEALILEKAAANRLILPAGSARALAEHLALVFKWNASLHLTSIRDAGEAVERHVLESVAVADRIDPALGRLLDVGSGNGYPALPFKILHSTLDVILLEPNLRKSVFLKQAAKALCLSGVEVRRSRIDHPGDLLPFAPLGTISMRAVAAVRPVCEGAVQALVQGGRLLLFLGPDQEAALNRLLPAGLRHAGRVLLPGRSRAHLTVLERAEG